MRWVRRLRSAGVICLSTQDPDLSSYSLHLNRVITAPSCRGRPERERILSSEFVFNPGKYRVDIAVIFEDKSLAAGGLGQALQDRVGRISVSAAMRRDGIDCDA